MRFFRQIVDIENQREELIAGRFGVIVVEQGQLNSINLRPWPKIVTIWESLGWGEYSHRHRVGDRCRLFYNQPRGSERYLALKYIHCQRGTSLRSFQTALLILDQVAEIKNSDALVCEAANLRLNPRFMRRYGWEQHTSSSRNYIKRFYGTYPVNNAKVVGRLAAPV
jgi:hypothetical protein